MENEEGNATDIKKESLQKWFHSFYCGSIRDDEYAQDFIARAWYGKSGKEYDAFLDNLLLPLIARSDAIWGDGPEKGGHGS